MFNKPVIRCTNLEFLNQCNVRYLLQNRSLYTPMSPAAARGIQMHSLLETAVGVSKEKALEEIDLIPDDGTKSHKEYYRTGLDLVLDVLKGVEVVSMEKKTELDLGYVALRGKPDLKCRMNGKFAIVDYKTSAQKYSEGEAAATFQLPFYAYMDEHVGQKVDLAVIINIYGQKAAKLDIQYREITPVDYEWIEALIKLAVAVDKRGIYKKNWGSLCAWCDYKGGPCKDLPSVVDVFKHDSLVIDTVKKWRGIWGT